MAFLRAIQPTLLLCALRSPKTSKAFVRAIQPTLLLYALVLL